jgi:hypothetical protein
MSGAVALAVSSQLSVDVQRHWLAGAALVWLAPLALYDLRHHAVPHQAFVAIPCLAAMAAALQHGEWALALTTALVVAASERRWLGRPRGERLAGGLAYGLAASVALTSGNVAAGAIAVLGFGLAYELGWWAGADALVAITLALLWPGVQLLAAFGVAHLLAAAGLRAMRLWWPQLAWSTPVPGLPVIWLALGLHLAWNLAMGM